MRKKNPTMEYVIVFIATKTFEIVIFVHNYRHNQRPYFLKFATKLKIKLKNSTRREPRWRRR